MGTFSTALRASEHGSVNILLDRNELVAGDVVAGRVRLSVTTRIDRADPIRMDIVGRETIRYDETETQCVTVVCEEEEDRDDHEGTRTKTTTKTKTKTRVHREKLEFSMLRDVILLDVPARAYEPGVYEFPFEYQLPTRGLVPTFEFRTSSLGNLRNVRACAEYELSVRVPITGWFTADLVDRRNPIIREDPSRQVPQRITESKTVPVHYCIFWLKGSCGLTATLASNVVPLGGEARIDVLVQNDSTQPVDSVTTTLRQIVTRNETRSSCDRDPQPTSETITIATKSFGGTAAAGQLSATLAQPIASDQRGSAPLVPTMQSHFLRFDYELTVRCRQAWCWQDAMMTVPIVLTTKTV